MRNCVMIIPAYKPDKHLLQTVESVKEAGFKDIVVVDDGSGAQYRPYFENAKQAGAVVLTHAVNMGKGHGQ